MKIIDKIYYYYMHKLIYKYAKFIVIYIIQDTPLNNPIKNFKIISSNEFKIKIGNANVRFYYGINFDSYYVKIDDEFIDRIPYNKKIIFIIYKELRKVYKELKSIRKEYIKNENKILEKKLLDKLLNK